MFLLVARCRMLKNRGVTSTWSFGLTSNWFYSDRGCESSFRLRVRVMDHLINLYFNHPANKRSSVYRTNDVSPLKITHSSTLDCRQQSSFTSFLIRSSFHTHDPLGLVWSAHVAFFLENMHSHEDRIGFWFFLTPVGSLTYSIALAGACTKGCSESSLFGVPTRACSQRQ